MCTCFYQTKRVCMTIFVPTSRGKAGSMPPQPNTAVFLPVILPDTLVVDSDEGIRLALRGVLEDAGYLVSVATTWQEAQRYMRNHPSALVILLDVSMPRPKDVLLLQCALQQAFASAALPRHHRPVLLSTWPNAADVLGRTLGVAFAIRVPILPKPFDIDDL
jgi:CheY-like chemotaxis protein